MTNDHLADVNLMHQLVQGDETALSILYDRYSKYVYTIADRVINNHELAEEITLDVFKQIWKKAAEFDEKKGTVQGWLNRITRNRAIDRFRKEKHHFEKLISTWTDLQSIQQGQPHLEQSLQSKEQKAKIATALQALTEPQRESITLAFFWGMSHQEIAEHLNIPLGTIKGRIRSGMQVLRQRLGQHSQTRNVE